ncbi:MAG: hypothetical protein ABIQ73_08335 [Acidimicrobiales bacterium]
MYKICATKKLLDRVKQPIDESGDEPSTALGDWYATALFWKPQVALFVNDRTLLPVFVELAPAAKLARRFPDQLGRVLEALRVSIEFGLQEVGAMSEVSYDKTRNRSVVGSMSEFAVMADWRRIKRGAEELVDLSVHLAGTPCGPLRNGLGFPDREVAALVAAVRER